MTAQRTMWKKTDVLARLESRSLQLTVDVSAPAKGLSNIHHEGVPLGNCHLLQIHTRRKRGLTDHYVRGCDLVARYAPGASDHYAPEIYWRALVSDEEVYGIELILTAKTNELRGETATTIQSDFPKTEVWWHRGDELGGFASVKVDHDRASKVGSGFLLYHISDRCSYAEMIYPSDFHAARLTRNESDGINVRYELFPELLEKGVIRRARVRGIFIDRPVDEPRAIACYQDFARSAPPLTV